MHYLRIARLLGILLLVLAACMATSLVWTIALDDYASTLAFLASAGITAACGGALWFPGRQSVGTLLRSDAIVLVTMSWLLLGAFGGLPYLFDGAFTNPADAYFEAVSGFTTTGSTVMVEIADHSHGLHWWRALTHWLGGMGIIVLFVAIFPQLGVGGKFLFKSEVPGPITEGLKPKIKQTASTLWWIYVSLTLIETLVLWALGMTLHEAITHAFATMATGGFSTRNGSVGEFDSASIDIVITAFMLIAGINFSLFYEVMRGRARRALVDRELLAYLFIIASTTLVITASIWGMDARHASLFDSIRYSAFQVVAVLTTTGFGTDDFALYPPLPQLLLIFMMFSGGMAGSTAGGMKIVRFLVLGKAIYAEVYKIFRPQSVMSIRLGHSVISPDTVSAILAFFALGIFTFVIASLYLTFLGCDVLTATTAVAATLFNIGPGLGLVGPTQNFAFLPTTGKVVLSVCMILGRLEFMTVFVLLLPDFWRRA